MERQTKQRRAILQVLEEQGRPLTPEEIYRYGREHVPRLGLTTVYRSIRKLVEEDRLVGVHYPGQPVRYEPPSRAEHLHFVCNQCRRIYDLPSREADPSGTVSLPDGFTEEGRELIVYGVCSGCGSA